MITQRPSHAVNTAPEPVSDTTKSAHETRACDTQEQHYRSAVYKVLANLLQNAPDSDALQQVATFAGIESQGEELALLMSMLGVSAAATDADAVDDEFHELFIGLGRGELMPYASWYLTGFLMEKPLSILRDDLLALGFERGEGVHEPEDHVAALCEVMSIMIDEDFTQSQQALFFTTHMSTWLERFFADLSQADAAVFYRSVGRLGQVFIAFEKHYLTLQD